MKLSGDSDSRPSHHPFESRIAEALPEFRGRRRTSMRRGREELRNRTVTRAFPRAS